MSSSSSATASVSLSGYAIGVLIPWALVTPLQFGQHIAALNQISTVLTCQVIVNGNDCIPMSDNTFSFVTSVFMIGGLVGSLFANKLLDRYGRKGCTRLNALLMTLGAATMALAQSVLYLVFGRFLIGVAAGVGLCTTPVYLDELSPPAIRGRVGVFNQLAVVIGILLIQGLGLLSAQRSQWRPVLWFSALLGVLQLVFSKFVVDTPVWLRSVGREGDASTVATRIWSMNKAHLDPTDDVVHRLLDEAEHTQPDSTPERELAQPPVSVAGAFTARELRQPLVIVAWIMFAQQVSGINAVMYYSNIIMARALPDAVQYISLGIAVVNAVMTLPAIILIEKMGRRGLLILSSTGVLASLLVVGYGIDAGKSVMSSVAITVFVGAFAIGLGPVPFVLIPEVSPFHGVSALSSIAISINWFINFFVGLLFLPLSHWLSDNNPYKEGRVFYLFAAVFFVSFVAFLRVYKG